MLRFSTLAAPLALIATPALAGEEVLYAESPAWVEPVDWQAAVASGEEFVLFDRQVRLEDGVARYYSDMAYEIANAQALTNAGTLQFGWLPDKGDLTLHRIAIIRDGEVIDVLAQGTRPQVIRRETELENRTVDGVLTAVVTVPGLKVGDILRFTSSITNRDQALGGEVQVTEGLIASPAKLGFGRVLVSWPEEEEMHWRMIGQAEDPQVIAADGSRRLQIALPIAEPEPMPGDAPARFTMGPALQLSSFADWSEVSAAMAPHFATKGTVAPDGAIAGEVARIMRAADDPLHRAALALRLVQDEVSYLMNGLDGGNYLPQSPADTWQMRYGDCKAKSLLLLAMLREMGIAADAVLVNSQYGDAVVVAQPQPGAFDHMIVRARIDGTDYWLDGTSAGTRLDTISEVPNFAHALPLVEGGTGLVEVAQRWPEVPDRIMRVTYDMSAGVDLPALIEVEVEARGVMGARMRATADETDPMQLVGAATHYLENLEGVFYDASYAYDEDRGVATMTARGLVFDRFGFERDVASHAVSSATTGWTFDPDRARGAWREIPYQVGGPLTMATQVTYILPENGEGAEVIGTGELDTLVAGTRFARSSSLIDGEFVLTDRTSHIPLEIAAADISAAKTEMRRLASGDPVLRITDPERSWELDDAEIGRRIEPSVAAMSELVALDEDEANFVFLRGLIHSLGRDFDAALADFDRAIALEATAERYLARANLLSETGKIEAALADAQRAYDLQGDVASATQLANLLVENGRAAEALALLDSLGVTGEEGNAVTMVWAELAGEADRIEDGWTMLETALAERPGDSSLLNSKCWFVGTWSHRLDSGEEVCDRAVRAGDYSAAALDSRALVYHRLGRHEDALNDLDAALAKVPGQAASLYLRGIIRLEQGDGAGRRDIEQALRIVPSLARVYERYGLVPKS